MTITCDIKEKQQHYFIVQALKALRLLLDISCTCISILFI